MEDSQKMEAVSKLTRDLLVELETRTVQIHYVGLRKE